MADLVGKTVGRYRIVARLGRGGMAEVYKAYQPGLDRYVAIKVLHSHLVDDKDFIGRFEREALAVGKLRHPNIVQALDFDREGEMYFMAMEFIDGPTLKEELRARKAANKPYTLREMARIFTSLCSAIDSAHARGMVHRDLKPANVMINREGQIVLTDFGIARIMGATQYTQTGALSGTPAYMSPEQGQGERGDKRSDIYSLGVMLYEMVTGVVPYDADTPFAVIMKHISEPLPLPTRVNPSLPEVVERVILKAMSKSPEDRYQTAGEFAVALRDAVGMTSEEALDPRPLTLVAPPPNVPQIDHATGPFTAVGEASPTVGRQSPTTVPAGQPDISSVAPATVVTPARGFPRMAIIIGGILVLLLVIGVLVGAYEYVRQNQQTVSAGQTAQAVAVVATETARADNQATEVAIQMVDATGTAEVAPTATVLAATNEASRVAATETAQFERDEALVQGALSRASTVTAEAIAITRAADETAVAESLQDVSNLALGTDTPQPSATSEPTATPEATEAATFTPVPIPPTDTPVPLPPTNTPIPANTPTPELPALSGKLAVPVDNGAGRYDVFIYSLPDGGQIGRIDGARQPHFRADGLKLLVNGEGGGFGENVFEANATGVVEKPVSGSPTDSFPVYHPDGSRIAYSNPQLAIGSDGSYHDYIFVQCSTMLPVQESDENCRDVARFGILVPAGQVGEIQGSNPVWTADDRIVYKGCNSWAGGASCGMYATVSWGNKRGGNGATPTRLIDGTSVTPTDTKGGLIAFHSRETGDWEAYLMRLDGSGVMNISNSPYSSDGLPTISPDGRWVAFASDRSGNWAIWVAPSSGGEPQKLLDFPKANPWATGGRDWTLERISWGP